MRDTTKKGFTIDGLVIALLTLAVGLIPVIGTLHRGGRWGVDGTIGLILASLGAIGVVVVLVSRKGR
jgi:hypothetical protein